MRDTYETQQFLDETAALELVKDVSAVRLTERSALLTCSLEKLRPALYDSYGTWYENVYLPPQAAGEATIQLDFCTPEIIRLRFAPGSTAPASNIPALDERLHADNTPMVVAAFDQPVKLSVEERATSLSLYTGSLRIEIEKQPWQMRIYRRGAEQPGQEIFQTRSRRLPAVEPRSAEIHFDPSWNFYHRYAYPLGIARRDGDACQVFDSFDLAHNEHFYGFGERYLALDKRGQKIHLWNEEVYSNTSSGAYKSIPFFMSSRGYGIFINTSLPITARLGDLTGAAWSLILDRATCLDYYFIYGPSFKEILPRYTQITGKPALPPKWSFGHWMSRITYLSQQEMEKTAAELRAHQIPTDVIHIDTGWYSQPGNCDLQFDAGRFPDPQGMFERLRSQGFKVSLWQTCNIAVGNPLYKKLNAIGGLVKRSDGRNYNRSGYDIDDCGLIDYSHPETVALMKEEFRRLFQMGAAAIKVDFGEGGPVDGVYHGYSGYAMHNLYALLYNQAVFEVTQEHFGAENALIWARSTWAGSQRYPVHWSGDGLATWRDLPCTLRSGLSFGLSGFVFWSHDIGGFSRLPEPELYARWAQLGCFSSHCRAHGEPPREPWHYGERTEAIYRQYLELRYRLLPYIYSQAVECVQRSLPMLRALVLEYQEDPNVAGIEDQYLFGDSLLVAPILTPDNRRKVYLPHGEWVDYWSKQGLSGGRWLDVEAPLETLPLWVRAGSILPMGPVQQYVDEKPLDPLTLELYAPEREGSFTIHDQGRPGIPIRYRHEGGRLQVELGAARGQVELVCYGFEFERAAHNGAALQIYSEAGHKVLRFDGRKPGLVELLQR